MWNLQKNVRCVRRNMFDFIHRYTCIYVNVHLQIRTYTYRVHICEWECFYICKNIVRYQSSLLTINLKNLSSGTNPWINEDHIPIKTIFTIKAENDYNTCIYIRHEEYHEVWNMCRAQIYEIRKNHVPKSDSFADQFVFFFVFFFLAFSYFFFFLSGQFYSQNLIVLDFLFIKKKVDFEWDISDITTPLLAKIQRSNFK